MAQARKRQRERPLSAVKLTSTYDKRIKLQKQAALNAAKVNKYRKLKAKLTADGTSLLPVRSSPPPPATGGALVLLRHRIARQRCSLSIHRESCCRRPLRTLSSISRRAPKRHRSQVGSQKRARRRNRVRLRMLLNYLGTPLTSVRRHNRVIAAMFVKRYASAQAGISTDGRSQSHTLNGLQRKRKARRWCAHTSTRLRVMIVSLVCSVKLVLVLRQAAQQAAKDEAMQVAHEREAQRQQAMQRRKQQHASFRKKTKTGQPVMSVRINKILGQLQTAA